MSDNAGSLSGDPAETGKKLQEVVLSPPRNYTDFTGKLILINGKEVTEDEIKKLSVANIESIIPFNSSDYTGSGETYKTKYGDKAKSGVIWITLKK
jgi:hypothetical protein